ncbi:MULTISPECIES: sortase domain-bontaining protein [Nocardioides]|uniref:Sortase domain-bontaining protein n=1 Tax=Nocardioides vastitatis TaxID=2568655 RepID=A0ABW0ZLQ3_9ACTN|nr:sortase [Nocardioides sp.]THI96636.1 class E sortase [Nocardioides sp.]
MTVWRAIGIAATGLLLVACSSSPRESGESGPEPTSTAPSPAPESSPPSASSGSAADTASPDAGPEPSDGRPRRATLTIRKLGIDDLVVVPYRGRTDDAPGTEIQDRGLAASPFGPEGGVGPGGIGNYQVTAHRLSSTQAFVDLPRLRRGDRVVVEVGERRYVYEITATRRTSFRSPASLRAQRAAVPGWPGAEPTRAMITLSTCATQEDHAAGNYWADELDNPEHRIDKIGVLVSSS